MQHQLAFPALSLALLVTACGQAPVTGTPAPGATAGPLIRVLSLPSQVQLVSLDLKGDEPATAPDSKIYEAVLQNGVASVQLGRIVRGNYTLTARAYDAADKKIVLYKASLSKNIQDSSAISLRLNRVTSAVTVNATLVTAKSNVLVAKLGGLEARLIASGDTATGVLPGVPTGRNLNLLVEGRDAGGVLRQQGSAGLDLSESDASVGVALQDVAATPPAVAGVSGPVSLKLGEVYTLRVQASQPAGGDGLKSVKVEWGDGSFDTFTVSGAGLDASYPHTYTAPGPQNVVVTVTNTAGLSAVATTTAAVQDVANPGVTIDIGAESAPVELRATGLPDGTERVQAIVDAPLGAQAMGKQDLKPQYILELVPRGSGTWSGTLGLPLGSAYKLTLRAFTGGASADSATPGFTPTQERTSFTFAYAPSGTGASCPAAPGAITPIHTIQGGGARSPLDGQAVTLRGVVTLDAQAGLRGFFVQDPSPDADPLTSEGLFVFTNAAPQTVKAGDLVQVSGTVTEFGSNEPVTELTTVSSFANCGAGTPVAPTTLTFPLASAAQLESLEGMLVTIPTPLTVTDTFGYGRYGELGLSSGGRVFNPTNGQGGDNASNALRRIVLDDLNSGQNPAVLPYLDPASNTRRTGDTVSGLTGTVHYLGGGYRIEPSVAPTFVNANPRPAAPNAVGGSLKVAGANVLNYFTQLVTSNDGCTPDGVSSTSRGANTCAEFLRQRTKIVNALKGLDADVVTLMEVQNNGDKALNNLVGALNAAYGADTYAALQTGVIGTDAIKVAMLYKPGKVEPVGGPQIDTNPVYSRPPLAQTFRDRAGGGVFTVVANHLKSKGGCPPAGTDPANQDSGQGCWNALRVSQAQALLTFVDRLKATDPDVLLMGDFNAYGDEDPIQTLTAAGFEGLNKRIPAEDRYSYQFGGNFGYLDHALASAGLRGQVTGITEWHINSDEPTLADYNLEFKNVPGCPSTTCTSPDLWQDNPYRASDHDPVLVGLNLTADATPTAPLSLTLGGEANVVAGQPYTLTISPSRAPDGLSVDWGDGTPVQSLDKAAISAQHVYAAAGTPTIKVTAASGADTASASKAITVTAAPQPGVGRLVISQVYGGGGNTGAPYSNDFVELFNAGRAPVSLKGASIQYAAAAGTFSATGVFALPDASVAPGAYYLVQLAKGAGTFAAMPTPDATGTLALGATSGKVALSSGTIPVSGKADASLLDFVGFGTANEFEGAGPTPALGNALAALRAAGGCTDSGNNAADFTAVTPTPRNSASPLNVCP